MEYISIHFLFLIVQVVCVSCIPLGRRSVRIMIELLPKQFAAMIAVNFAIAWGIGWLFGATTLIVVEALGIAVAALIFYKDDGISKGLKILEQIHKVQYMG